MDFLSFHDRISFLLGQDNSQDKDHAAFYEECSNFHVRKYNLRKDVRKNQRSFTTWIDEDDSGNYDPRESSGPSRPPRRKRIVRQNLSTSNHQQQIGHDTANEPRRDKTTCFAVEETAKKQPEEPASTESTIRVPYFPTRPRRLDGRKGNTKTILTSYAHPIIFNHQALTNEAPCNWCVSVGYGVAGLGRRRVTVIDWGDGIGYDEVSGGHFNDEREQSRMCEDCTTNRMEILACTRHNLQPILGRSAPTFDFSAAYIQLRAGISLEDAEALWCALCPSPAFYECCTTTEDSDDQGSGESGCGLYLCETCSNLLSKFKGDLQKMFLDTEQTLRKDFPVGFRADALFLRREGELFRQVYKGAFPCL